MNAPTLVVGRVDHPVCQVEVECEARPAGEILGIGAEARSLEEEANGLVVRIKVAEPQ